MEQELELIEENSESCPVDTTTPSGGIPMVMVMAVGVLMVVGIMYMGGEEPTPKIGEIK